jgi:hypothetical protein
VALLNIDDNGLRALKPSYSEFRKRTEQSANVLSTFYALCECVAV